VSKLVGTGVSVWGRPNGRRQISWRPNGGAKTPAPDRPIPGPWCCEAAVLTHRPVPECECVPPPKVPPPPPGCSPSPVPASKVERRWANRPQRASQRTATLFLPTWLPLSSKRTPGEAGRVVTSLPCPCQLLVSVAGIHSYRAHWASKLVSSGWRISLCGLRGAKGNFTQTSNRNRPTR